MTEYTEYIFIYTTVKDNYHFLQNPKKTTIIYI